MRDEVYEKPQRNNWWKNNISAKHDSQKFENLLNLHALKTKYFDLIAYA